MKSLETFIRNGDSWLKGNNRVDTKYTAARAYENLNVPVESERLYQESMKIYDGYSSPNKRNVRMFLRRCRHLIEINLRLGGK